MPFSSAAEQWQPRRKRLSTRTNQCSPPFWKTRFQVSKTRAAAALAGTTPLSPTSRARYSRRPVRSITSARCLCATRPIWTGPFRWYASTATASLPRAVRATILSTASRTMVSAPRRQCLSPVHSMATLSTISMSSSV